MLLVLKKKSCAAVEFLAEHYQLQIRQLNDAGVRAVVIMKSKISFQGRPALLVVFFIVIDDSSI